MAEPRKKPEKPYPAFPLFAHGNGMWAKRIRGQVRYFGKWADPQAALSKYLAQKDALYAGREPLPVGPDEWTVRDLCNQYLTAKKAAVAAGDITERSFREYLAACKRLARVVGAETAVAHLVREDFSRLRADMAKTWGPVRILNEIRRVRMIFNWGVAQTILDRLPTYGDGMKWPSAKVLRKNRSDKGLRMFQAEQIRALLAAAGPTLKAMILLGINCGYGNTDMGRMERGHVDLKTGWTDYPRPKTGVPRRCPLWPETVKAIRRVLNLRSKRKAPLPPAVAVPADGSQEATPIAAVGTDTPAPAVVDVVSVPKKYRKLLFLTTYNGPWEGSVLSMIFGRLVRRLGFHRPGLNFYALRHTFQTVGSQTKDETAVSAIMGHAPQTSDFSSVYREQIDDQRLRDVTDHVHNWLWPKKESGQKDEGQKDKTGGGEKGKLGKGK
jgi:integrase